MAENYPNPFRAAIQPRPPEEVPTVQRDIVRDMEKVYGQGTLVPMSTNTIHGYTARELLNMTRQELFDLDLLTVEDMDDEELRRGQCRLPNGRFEDRKGMHRLIKKDKYDKLVAEHMKRNNDKIRSQMDAALEVMCDIMNDDTCEPKDRMDAAKYIFERSAGKTPDKVDVKVSTQPWEDMFSGISNTTRRASRAQRGIQDAEFTVEDSDGPVQDTQSNAAKDVGQNGYSSNATPRQKREAEGQRIEPQESPGDGIAWAARGSDSGSEAQGADHPDVRVDVDEEPDDIRSTGGIQEPSPVEQLGIHDADLMGDLRITPPTAMPGGANPATNQPDVAPEVVVAQSNTSNSEKLRENLDAQLDLAQRRKAAKERIQGAKRKRIVQRTMGVNGLQKTKINLTEGDDGKLKFSVD